MMERSESHALQTFLMALTFLAVFFSAWATEILGRCQGGREGRVEKMQLATYIPLIDASIIRPFLPPSLPPFLPSFLSRRARHFWCLPVWPGHAPRPPLHPQDLRT